MQPRPSTTTYLMSSYALRLLDAADKLAQSLRVQGEHEEITSYFSVAIQQKRDVLSTKTWDRQYRSAEQMYERVFAAHARFSDDYNTSTVFSSNQVERFAPLRVRLACINSVVGDVSFPRRYATRYNNFVHRAFEDIQLDADPLIQRTNQAGWSNFVVSAVRRHHNRVERVIDLDNKSGKPHWVPVDPVFKVPSSDNDADAGQGTENKRKRDEEQDGHQCLDHLSPKRRNGVSKVLDIKLTKRGEPRFLVHRLHGSRPVWVKPSVVPDDLLRQFLHERNAEDVHLHDDGFTRYRCLDLNARPVEFFLAFD